MSDVNNEVKQGADSLAPIKDKDRIMEIGRASCRERV